MVKKFCNHPGCNALIDRGATYCPKHESLHGFHKNPYEYLYNIPLWKKMRKEFLKDNPTCAVCGGKATVVDHIVAHRGNVELFWNQSNWQPLCKECHDAKTNREIASRNRRDPY